MRTYARARAAVAEWGKETLGFLKFFRLLLPIRTYVAGFGGKKGFTGAHPCRPIRSYGKGIGDMNVGGGDHLVDLAA